MIKLRLQRTGAKNNAHYKVVVAPSTAPRDGRYIESIGHYHPSAPAPQQLLIQKEKAEAWLKKGAQPTDTVKALLKSQGIS